MNRGCLLGCTLLIGGAALSCSGGPREMTPAEWLEENTTLLENLRSYDADERREAINTFKRVGKERGTRYALVLLYDKKLEDYRTQVVLARILADWNDKRAIPFLLQHLYHQDQGAVEIAKQGLQVFKDEPRLVEALEEKVKGPVVRERRIATEVLSEIGGDRAVELFGESYRSEPENEIRALFLMAISESRHPRRREYLIDALTDPDEALRELAWYALRKDARLPAVKFDPKSSPKARADAVALLRLWLQGGDDARGPR